MARQPKEIVRSRGSSINVENDGSSRDKRRNELGPPSKIRRHKSAAYHAPLFTSMESRYIMDRKASSLSTFSSAWSTHPEKALRATIDERTRQARKLLQKRRMQSDWNGRVVHQVMAVFTLKTLWHPTCQEEYQLKHQHRQLDIAVHARALHLLETLQGRIHPQDSDEAIRDLLLIDGVHDLPSDLMIDQYLSYDTLFHILTKQLSWFNEMVYLRETSLGTTTQMQQRSISMIGDVENNPRWSKEASSFMQAFGLKVQSSSSLGSTKSRVVLHHDLPTADDAYFEQLLTQFKFLRSPTGCALDKSVHNILTRVIEAIQMNSFETFDMRIDEATSTDHLYEVISAMQKRVQVVLIKDNLVSKEMHEQIQLSVESLLHSRLSIFLYVRDYEMLNQRNRQWRAQLASIGGFHLNEVNFPACCQDILQQNMSQSLRSTACFERSIHGINSWGHLIPSRIMEQVRQTITIIHEEVSNFFNIESSQVCVDLLMPALLYILSHASSPFIHTQIQILDAHMASLGTAGCEMSYYMTCIRSVVDYIMTYNAEKKTTKK